VTLVAYKNNQKLNLQHASKLSCDYILKGISMALQNPDFTEFQNILENYSEFKYTIVKEKWIEKIFCECIQYHSGIIDILPYLQAEEVREENAIKIFYKSRHFDFAVYFKNNKIHRDHDKPAVTVCYLNDNILVTWSVHEIWYKHNRLYRKNNASVILTNYFICLQDEYNIVIDIDEEIKISENDKPHKIMKYWKQGENLHNLNGPAKIKQKNLIREEQYWIKGIQYCKKDYKIMRWCFIFAYKLKKLVLSRVIYNSGFCKDISNMISSYIY